MIRLGGVFSSARAKVSSHGKASTAEPTLRNCLRVNCALFKFILDPRVLKGTVLRTNFQACRCFVSPV
jgi:hypothetical protein